MEALGITVPAVCVAVFAGAKLIKYLERNNRGEAPSQQEPLLRAAGEEGRYHSMQDSDDQNPNESAIGVNHLSISANSEGDPSNLEAVQLDSVIDVKEVEAEGAKGGSSPRSVKL